MKDKQHINPAQPPESAGMQAQNRPVRQCFMSASRLRRSTAALLETAPLLPISDFSRFIQPWNNLFAHQNPASPARPNQLQNKTSVRKPALQTVRNVPGLHSAKPAESSKTNLSARHAFGPSLHRPGTDALHPEVPQRALERILERFREKDINGHSDAAVPSGGGRPSAHTSPDLSAVPCPSGSGTYSEKPKNGKLHIPQAIKAMDMEISSGEHRAHAGKASPVPASGMDTSSFAPQEPQRHLPASALKDRVDRKMREWMANMPLPGRQKVSHRPSGASKDSSTLSSFSSIISSGLSPESPVSGIPVRGAQADQPGSVREPGGYSSTSDAAQPKPLMNLSNMVDALETRSSANLRRKHPGSNPVPAMHMPAPGFEIREAGANVKSPFRSSVTPETRSQAPEIRWLEEDRLAEQLHSVLWRQARRRGVNLS